MALPGVVDIINKATGTVAPAAANYNRAASADGGVNYFLGSTPITRQDYEVGIGASTNGYVPGATATTATSTPPPTSPNGAPAVQDKSGDIALQNAGISALGEQTTSGLSAIDKALGNIYGQYDTEKAANEADYSTKSDTNQNNLQRNKQTAMVNATQGRRGLFGTLASLGALNGSGVDLANNAVQKGANEDLAGAGDTYGANQTTLDDSIGKFHAEDTRRREENKTAAENARTNVHSNEAKSRQTYLKNLSDDYTAQGNAGTAKSYADQAGALFPEIAKYSIPSSNLAASAAAYTPGSLASYLTGANSTQVTATPATGASKMPGLTATPVKKKA